MDHLLGLCTLFPLFSFSSSSNFCGLQYSDPKLDKDNNLSSEHSEAPKAPWLVNIYGNGQRCQGVILSSLWVLTAANCFLLMNPSQVELTASPGHFSTKTVSQFLLHRGFSSWNKAPNNDLGLILLGQPIDLRTKDMWPACIPQEEKPYNTQEECRIFERGQQGSMRWFLKETMVEALSISDCSKHWPDTTEGWNLCVAKMESPKHTSCKVPVGSPVICHDPATWEWEVIGLVSQSLHNCTVPILASQLLSHLQWLKRVGALENPLQPKDKLPSAAGEQPVTLLEPAKATPAGILQGPVTLPVAEQTIKLPSPEAAITASLSPVQTITTTTTEFPSTNLPSLGATTAATVASPPTKPPALETTTITEATKLPPVETTTATTSKLPSTNLPSLKATTAATIASPPAKPPAFETTTITEVTKLPPVETTTATTSKLPSTDLPSLKATTAATIASPPTKPPAFETTTITEATKLSPVETTTATTSKLPSTNLPSLKATTAATVAFPPTKPPALETTTITEAPQLERTMTTILSLAQTAKQLSVVSLTTKNSILYSSKVAKPAEKANNVILTTAHKSSPITSASFSPTTEPQHGAPSSGQLPQATSSISGWSTTAGTASTKLSFTPTQQSYATSMTTYQSPPVASSTTKKSSVTLVTTKPFSQTPEPQHVILTTTGQLPQVTSSITGQSSVMTTQTLVAPTTGQSLQTSSIVTHHHIVILPPPSLRQSKPLSPPGTR